MFGGAEVSTDLLKNPLVMQALIWLLQQRSVEIKSAR